MSGVLHEWESIVNRVTTEEVWEKKIVCGSAARWWDSELKDKISLRREVYQSYTPLPQEIQWLSGKEGVTSNQKVLGSNPSWILNFFRIFNDLALM